MDTPKFRDYTERELKIINGYFTPYLFYENISHKDRRCICSYCGHEYTVTPNDYEIFTARHNEWVTCKKCRQKVQAKSKGKVKSGQNLWESHRVVTIYRVNENEVRIIADEAVKSYLWCHNPNIKFYHSSRYIIKPGEVSHYRCSYYETSEQKSFGEPFRPKNNGVWYCVKPDNSYKIIGLERLGSTFLKYNMLNEYLQYKCSDKAVSYLCQFAMHPQMELLQKLGYYDIVRNLVELKNKSYPYVNWGAESLDKFLKLSKAELKEFRQINGDLKLLKMVYLMKRYYKAKNPIQKALEIESQIEGYYIGAKADDVKESLSQAKRYDIPGPEVVNYIIKKQTSKKRFCDTKQEYFDYVRMGKDLGYDFKEHNVVFPKDLTKSHDLANETHIVWLEEKKAKEEAERDKAAQKGLKKKDRQYCFTDGKFLITVPHSTKEILEEGRKQKHCVGGYAGRHMEGKLTICFLRTAEKPDEPLYTIEMHDKKLTQVQGYGNRTPLTTAAKLFFDKWLDWVNLGSKRDKNGNPILVKRLAEATA